MKKLIRIGLAALLVCGMFFTNISPAAIAFAENQAPDSSAKLNYLYVDQPYMQVPGEQGFVVSFGNGTENITHMSLLLQRNDGKTFEAVLNQREADTYLLKNTFVSGDEGVYQVSTLSYTMSEQHYTLNLLDIGVDAKFGIGETYPGYNEDGPVVTSNDPIDENLSVSIVQAEDGQEVTSESIEKAIVSANDGVETFSEFDPNSRSRSGNLVVVIDPGHGGRDPGASANGVIEKDAVLKIAKYCRDALKQYNGVTVFMTREDDRYLGLTERVTIAKNYGADIFVSIHLNAFSSPSANGAEVFYPNSNYNNSIYQEGKHTAENILNQLVALGLNNRGIKVSYATNGNEYPDGSTGDYYTVINESKRAGFPGLIVEHAFLTNPADAEKLKDENFLVQLGIADAAGIAQAYGLSKGADAFDPSMPYTDVPAGAWYYDAAKEARQRGLLTGLNPTTFAPGDSLTRGMVATILWRHAGQPAINTSSSFPDLADGQFYTTAILWANENKIMTGYDNGYCGANDNVTREQFATLMYRYASKLGLDTKQTANLNAFSDGANTTPFAIPAVQWCVANKIITGNANGTLDPHGLTNRAAAATIIIRFLNQYGL